MKKIKTMVLNVIIVEDVHDNIDTLKYLLDKCPVDINIIGIADNLPDAKKLFKLPNIDIAFLDIQFKNGNIFDILSEASINGQINFELVFITAFSSFEMAVKAIQFACLDYITKPIEQSKLDTVILKTVKENGRNNTQKQLKLLLETVKGNFEFPKSISINLPKGVIEIVQIENILYFKADKNTCVINFIDNNIKHSVKSFSYYLGLLNAHPDFIQISRNLCVNTNHIKRYNHRVKEITLVSNEALVVSHRMSQAVKQRLANEFSIWENIKNLFMQ